MSSLTPNSDAAPRESGKWECRAQGRKTAASIGAAPGPADRAEPTGPARGAGG
jgi:hypothetical protein